MDEIKIGCKQKCCASYQKPRVKAPMSAEYHELEQLIKDANLNTVCREAACPNIGECWANRHAAFMILGDTCTRSCAFCNIKTGRPQIIDKNEPERVALAVKHLQLKHVVITSVTRDDLPDGGAQHFADTINEVRKHNLHTTIEVLTPDFLHKDGAVKIIVQAKPDIFNHNLETIPSLYKKIRPVARYFNSLLLLKQVKDADAAIYTKSGLMVGLGEKREEILQVMDDLRVANVDFLTIGQYLQPTPENCSVVEYISDETFEFYRVQGLRRGFKMVTSSPLTRSSYHAGDYFEKLKTSL